MSNIIIKDKEILVKEYKSQRVVTLYDIAKVHNKVVNDVTKTFNNNRNKFIEGIEFFSLTPIEFSELFPSVQDFIPNNVKEIILFTEYGYLLICKPFKDDLSWEVQRILIDNYFKIKESTTPRTFAEALRLAADQAEQIEKLELDNKLKQQRILEMEPKENYYDKILQSKELLTITQIAKDYGMTGIEMNQKLKELGVQYKQGKIWLLKEKYQTQGYTKTKTVSYNHSDGTPDSNTYTCWTQKGRLFLYDLLKHNNVLPLIEQEEVDE